MKKRLKQAYQIYLQGKIDEVSLDPRLQPYLDANQQLFKLKGLLDKKTNVIKNMLKK